ncbi:MAG: cupin-like domain-containing protein [Planctomycetes bacterium]|nr:cupin-like domain-containing protein [Planctomycetota bacterium]
MPSFAGPTFQFVDTVAWEDLVRAGGFGPRSTPLLVKGAVRAWPAWEHWSFRNLSELRRPDGSEIIFRFQNGLVEQGVTRQPLDLPIGPYIRELAEAAERPRREEVGLLPYRRWKEIVPGQTFHLDWEYMKSFEANRVYLAQWHILEEFPAMRRDFAIRDLWPGWRWTWEFVFIGPSNTVTGLHYDFPNNWFCQVRGLKEVILFPPDQTPHMCKSRKYDWGATLSDIDISRLDEQPAERATFEKARGLYARIEAGDALFIPRRTWHAVVALEPSISLAVFGLRPAEILIGGGASTARQLLHKFHLYRWGNCTCHKMHRRAKAA